MKTNQFILHYVAAGLLVAAMISATPAALATDMVPFNGTVSGYINALPSDVVNFGNANQLGAFTGTADFYPNPPDPVTGCCTATALDRVDGPGLRRARGVQSASR